MSGMKDKKHSEETKNKMRLAASKRSPPSKDTKIKISNTLTGTKQSAETCAKKSAAHTGLKHSEETKLKIKLSNKLANFKYRYSDLSKLYPTSFAEFFPAKNNGKGWMRRPYASQLVKNIQSHAARRGLNIELDQIEIFDLIHAPCYYCGLEVNFPHSRNGIDRVDNNIGYLKNNVISCCWVCNRAKGSMSVDEFDTWTIRRYNCLLVKLNN